jgi:hypothetical protein
MQRRQERRELMPRKAENGNAAVQARRRYWYKFWYGGRRYRKSTNLNNQRDAGDIERAFRTALAKGEVGITERNPVPGLRASMADFLNWSAEEHAVHPRTHVRYKTSRM